jgi:1-acyl-sn-glycerol-3-phosphate acyltransferase
VRYHAAVRSLRAALSSVFVVFFTVCGSLLAFGSCFFNRSGDGVVHLAKLWSRCVLRFAGVRLSVEWRGAISPGRPYVFMANHVSAVDIWALFMALPPVRMIAKKQLAAIPLFGWAMWAGRFIFIDRANAVAARRSIDEAGRRIRGGESVVIFPEGTRSRDGRLGPFKKGGFHLAIHAGVPIVPVALLGTRAAMPRGSMLLRSGEVRAVIGSPIATEGLTEADRNKLLERVRDEIAAMLGEPPAPSTASAVRDPSSSHAGGA